MARLKSEKRTLLMRRCTMQMHYDAQLPVALDDLEGLLGPAELLIGGRGLVVLAGSERFCAFLPLPRFSA